MKTISYEQWFEEYKPQLNHFTSSPNNDIYGFETFGEELDYVKSSEFNDKQIWTLVDGDNETSWIIPGYHLINRSLYYITEIPWEDENIQVNDNEMISIGEAKYACKEFIEDGLGIELSCELEDNLHNFWSQIK